MVDDSHATGFMGATGRGTPEHCGVADARSTSSPARSARRSAAPAAATSPRARRLSSGCASARAPICSPTASRRSSPASSLRVLDLLDDTPELRTRLFENARHFRAGLEGAGFDLEAGRAPDHSGDARRRRAGRPHGGPTARSAASTSSASLSRWCPRDRRASARRCPRRSPASSSTAPSQPSRRSAASSASSTEQSRSNNMKALVKKEAAPGIWLEDVPEPKVGPERCADRDRQDGDLRHRHAHLQVGRLGAEDHSGADGRGPRVLRAHRRAGLRGPRAQGRRPRLRRRPHHLRLLPQLPRRPPPPVPQHGRRRREPPGRLRRVSGDPGRQRLQAARLHSATTSPRFSIRSATPPTPPSPSTWWARTC